MAFSFNPSLSTDRDWVRLRIGDTDASWPLLQDDTIDAILAAHGNDRLRAALACARAIVAQLARQADTDNTGLSVRASQRAEAYRKLVAELEQEIAGTGVPVWVQPDAPPSFALGMHDYRGA